MTAAIHPFDTLMDITARPPVVFVRGEGGWLWDDSGRRYLDFVQGWAVNSLGHSPPALADALAAQARKLLTPSPAFYNAPSLRLAQLLVESSGFDQVFFANSGAEANEGAIKLARKYGTLHRGGAHEIITFAGAFHGRTLATMSACGKKAFEPLFEPKVPGFPKATLNDLASVERLIGARPGQKLEVNFRAASLERTVRRAGRRLAIGLVAAAALLGTAITATSTRVDTWVPLTLGAVGLLFVVGLVVDLVRDRRDRIL